MNGDWVRGRLVAGLVLGEVGDTLVLDVSDVSTISVINPVGDDLGTAVAKGDTVLAGNNTVVILQSDKNQSSKDPKIIGTQTHFGIDFRVGFVK